MRILLIEDEEKLAAAVSEGLTKRGYAVDTIADGDTAFTRISIHHGDYDLVILDLMLPGMDGATICKKIRERGVKIPICILAARKEATTKVDLLSTGADDYLVKPFSFEELTARMQALLRRPQEMVPVVLKAHDLELNPSERTVKRRGKLIELTLKEFGLLEYFMRHPNQVINREELLSHLWDFNYSSFSNVVDVHIKNLRKKITKGKENILETIRGVGYRLRD